MSIKSVMPSNHLILCHPHLLLPSIFPSIRIFSNEAVLPIRWPKLLELQLQHQSFQLIFRTDFLYDWLVWSPFNRRDFQDFSPTPQFKSINSSALNFLYSQLSHPYMTSGKTIALTKRTFVGKVISLLFHMLSRFVIAFLLRSKSLLISWLQSLSTVVLEPKKIKSVIVSIFSQSICHEVMGLDAMILVFWMVSFKPAFSILFHFYQEAL